MRVSHLSFFFIFVFSLSFVILGDELPKFDAFVKSQNRCNNI